MNHLIERLQLELQTGDRSVLHTGWRARGDNSGFARLYLVTGGEGWARHHGRAFRLRPGRLYLIPARSGVDFGCNKEVSIWWVHFRATLASATDFFLIFPPAYEIPCRAGLDLKPLFDRMLQLKGRAGVDAALEERGILLQILSRFYSGGGARGESRPSWREEEWERFRPVFEFIRNNPGGKIRVSGLASVVRLDRCSFSTRFRRLCGMSPARYIAVQRVESVRVLLSRADEKLESIAAQTGFCDGFHLSKVFKRITGLSPAEYRLRQAMRMP